MVLSFGDAYWWSEASGEFIYLDSGVMQVTTGFDRNGNSIIDLLYSNGIVDEYRDGLGWSFLDYNVRSLSKSRAGIVDTVSNADNAWEFDDSGNSVLLMSSANQAT
jgi:hypothetical protein